MTRATGVVSMTAPMTPECRTVFMLGVGIMGRDVGVFIVGEVPIGGACTYGASCAVEGFGFGYFCLDWWYNCRHSNT